MHHLRELVVHRDRVRRRCVLVGIRCERPPPMKTGPSALDVDGLCKGPLCAWCGNRQFNMAHAWSFPLTVVEWVRDVVVQHALKSLKNVTPTQKPKPHVEFGSRASQTRQQPSHQKCGPGSQQSRTFTVTKQQRQGGLNATYPVSNNQQLHRHRRVVDRSVRTNTPHTQGA